jgi:nucleotide-binding universal stress UspA family protein
LGTPGAEAEGMTIIAAVDLSPASVNAARSAALLARVMHDKLLLVRAIEPVSAFYPEMALAGLPDLEDAVRRASLEALANIRLMLADLASGVEIEIRVQAGDPQGVLCDCARSESARFIVMGTHSRSRAGRLFHGSAAQRTMRQAPCPVLVLREGSAPFVDWAAQRRPLRIVAGVDRSVASEAALEVLATLRAAGPCDVTLVHDYWPPGEYARLGLRGPRDLSRDDEEVVAVIKRELGEIWAAQPPGSAADKVTIQVRAGWQTAGVELALDAEAAAADLLIVGTEQAHGLGRLRRGSEALAALQTCAVPLLVVPVRAHKVVPATRPIPVIRKVLVATDLSDFGNAAIPHAYALARRSGAQVEICHVREHTLPSPAYLLPDVVPALPAAERRELEQRLAALVPGEAATIGVASHVTVIDGGIAPIQILQAAHLLGADAIVVSSHGRTGIGRTLLGSVAEAIVHKSDLPVYIVRPTLH